MSPMALLRVVLIYRRFTAYRSTSTKPPCKFCYSSRAYACGHRHPQNLVGAHPSLERQKNSLLKRPAFARHGSRKNFDFLVLWGYARVTKAKGNPLTGLASTARFSKLKITLILAKNRAVTVTEIALPVYISRQFKKN